MTRVPQAEIRPWRRYLLYSAIAVCLILASGEVIVRLMIDTSFLEQRINQRLERGESPYRISIGEVSASLLFRSLRADSIRLLPRGGLDLAVDSVRLGGINPIRSWWRGGLAAGDIEIWSPSVTITDLPVRHYRAALDQSHVRYVNATGPGDSALGLVNRSLAHSLPFLACDELKITDGSLSLGHVRGDDTTLFSADRIGATFTDLLVDTTDETSRERLFFCRDFSFDADGPKRLVGDSLYQLQIGTISGSAESQSITLDSGSIILSVSEDEFAAKHEFRAYAFKAAVRGVTLRHADFARLVRQEIVLEHLEIDSLFFYLFSDKKLPPDKSAGPPLMPHEAFQRIPWYVAIDSLTINDGEVIYAERAEDGRWPGTIRFTDTRAAIHNITNDPSRMTTRTPALLYLSGRIEGSAGMSVTMNYPLLSPELTMNYRGVVGRLDARLLNHMLVNLEGAKITSGMADSITFEVAVEDNRAAGSLTAAYRELHVDVVSKVDTGQGLFKKLKSALFNYGVLKDHNLPEKARTYEVGRIHYARRVEDPFFKFLWVTIREGLMDVVGMK